MKVHAWWGYLLVLACYLHASPLPGTQGRVLDAVTGRGIPGVRVTTFIGSSLIVSIHTITDSNGDFEFAQVTGALSCEREGYKQFSGDEVAGADGTRPESFNSLGRVITAPLLIMMMPVEYARRFASPDAFLSGLVVDETTHPVRRAEVTVRLSQPSDNEHFSAVETDAQGRFALRVPPGRVELTASVRRCDSGGHGGNPPEARASLPHQLSLGLGENRQVRVVIKPVPTYSLAGIIQNGVAPYGGIIELLLSGCPPKSIKETAHAFSLYGVPAGTYLLNATLSREVQCDTCSNEPVYPVAEKIEVPEKKGRSIRVHFYPGIEVTGAIHWEGDVSQFVAPRSLCIANLAGQHFCNDGKDSKSIRLSRIQPGEYRVIAGIPPGKFQILRRGDFYLNKARLNDKPFSPEKLILREDMDRAILDLYGSESAAHCVARVVDREHHPLNLYSAVLMQKRGDHYALMDFDPLLPERYSFVPGEYLLVALTPALPKIAIRAEILEQYAGQATPITLTAGQTLNIELVAIEDHPLSRYLQ